MWEPKSEWKKIVPGSPRVQNMTVEDSQWNLISNMCRYRKGVGQGLTKKYKEEKEKITERAFSNADLGVSALPTFWRTKESQGDLQKRPWCPQGNLSEGKPWHLVVKLILHIKWGHEKAIFFSDQSPSGELMKKHQNEGAELLSRPTMLIKYSTVPHQRSNVL